MDKETTVQELKTLVSNFRDERDWKKYNTPKNLAVSICIEAAELLEQFQWKNDDEVSRMVRDVGERNGVSDELADVIIYCLGLSDILNIDVAEAVKNKLEKNIRNIQCQRQKLPPRMSRWRIRVNNRFFADRNDFFKYDLLLEILEKSNLLKRLTFIPMLTPNDDRRGGHRTNYSCGLMREELFRFLQECLVNGKRDIRELHRFFENRGFRYFLYRDSEFFRHESRNEYFHNIPIAALHKALVFLDPDNGLEVASMRAENGDRYVKYHEAGTLSARMDDYSVLMLYQHLPRQNRRQFFFETAKKLWNYLHLRNLFLVSDNSIAFVILTKNGQRSHWLGKVLASYADAQRLSFMSGINLEDPKVKAAGK